MTAEHVQFHRWVIGGRCPSCYVDASEGKGMIVISYSGRGGASHEIFLTTLDARDLAEALGQAVEIAEMEVGDE